MMQHLQFMVTEDRRTVWHTYCPEVTIKRCLSAHYQHFPQSTREHTQRTQLGRMNENFTRPLLSHTRFYVCQPSVTPALGINGSPLTTHLSESPAQTKPVRPQKHVSLRMLEPEAAKNPSLPAQRSAAQTERDTQSGWKRKFPESQVLLGMKWCVCVCVWCGGAG